MTGTTGTTYRHLKPSKANQPGTGSGTTRNQSPEQVGTMGPHVVGTMSRSTLSWSGDARPHGCWIDARVGSSADNWLTRTLDPLRLKAARPPRMSPTQETRRSR